MKVLLFIIVFICSLASCLGQVQFSSSITQHWPTMFTTQFEEVDRSIWIDNEEITISTETVNGKEIETLKIASFEHSENNIIFTCTAHMGSQPVTVIVPEPEKLYAIDIYRTSPKTGEEVQIRFHLN